MECSEAYLEAKDLRLDEGKGFAIDFDEAVAFLRLGSVFPRSISLREETFRTLQWATAVAVLRRQFDSCL